MTFIDRTSLSNRCVAVVLGLSLVLSAFPASFFGFNFAFAAPANVEQLVINEIHIDGTDDWVEIYNLGPSTVGAGEASRLSIHDGAGHVIDLPNTSIAADSYVVLEVNNRFDNGGDTVELIYDNPGGSGGEEIIDDLAYGSEGPVSLPTSGETISRIPNGSGDFSSATPTKEANNNPPEPIVKSAEFITVFGNTFTFYDEPGTWWFNRDVNTATEFEFNTDESTIGDGSLYVFPIDGNLNGDDDKFIGELFVHELVEDIESISYNYQIGAGSPSGKANEFYANAYVNYDDSDNFGHCVYNIVPSDDSAGWHTMTFDPDQSYAVRTRGSAPESCPSVPSDLPDTAELRMFAINLGDTSDSDDDVSGYFDEVVVETTNKVTTYDLEPREDVKPIFECYVDNGDNTGTGYFGYLNENDAAVDIAISGSNNKVSGGPNGNDEGQPTTFDPGRTDYVDDAGVFKPGNAAFSVDFSLSGNAVWTLDGRTATAGTNGAECPEPEVPQCVNLLENGSFEEEEVTDKKLWQPFAAVTGWLIEQVSDQSATTLEHHRGWSGNAAADEDQYVELDGEHATQINQEVATLTRGVYELSWAFAPRHNIDAAENQLSVLVDGVEVATEGPDTAPAGLTPGDWTRNSHQFTATGPSTTISFADIGATSDSFGTFLDDAQLCLVEEPEPAAEIVVTKIVCEDEALLPNDGYSSIDENTASEFLSSTAAREAGCHLGEGVSFEYVTDLVSSDTYDSNGGAMGAPFSTSVPTDSNGETTIVLTASELDDMNDVSVREVLSTDYYVPFSGKNGSDVSAEFYCHQDAKFYDNMEWMTDVAVDNTYHCVAWNAPVEKTSTVTMCKYDTEEMPLPNWQLALVGDTVDTMAFTPDSTTQSFSNVPAGDYVLTAAGAYEYRGNSGLLADARFSERKAGDDGFGTYPFQPWRIANPATGGLAVSVDGDKGDLWGSMFSATHTYYGGVTLASDDDIDLTLYDNQYNDNVGDIDITLAHGFAGATNDDGCVTFENVPYGDYTVAEVLPPEWSNESGLGTVMVDDETEEFTVVNLDPDYVPTCELTIVSDDTDYVVEKDDTAVALSFIHPKWVESLSDSFWIWGDDGPDDSSTEEIQNFIKQFGINPAVTVTNATLQIASDNQFAADLNGTFTVDDDDEDNYAAVQAYDVTTDVLPGNNELAVEVTNLEGSSNPEANPAGLYYELVITGEGAEQCGVPYEPETAPYCGDGEVNGEWEQCEPGDKGCTDYCLLANQCHTEQLVKITLDDEAPASESFDGMIYLGDEDVTIPSGTWFNFGIAGDSAVTAVANDVDGLAVTRNQTDGTLELAFTGDNLSKELDYVMGEIETLGIDLGAVDRDLPLNYDLENGSGGSFDDVFAVDTTNDTVDFDLRADTGNDGVSVEVAAGAEYGQCTPDTYTISGYKWQDDNGNGEWDDNEPAKSGWTIYLDSEETSTSTTTNDDGYYEFTVTSGWYEVTEEQRPGWTQTAPTSSSFLLADVEGDSEGDSYGSCTYAFYDQPQYLLAATNESAEMNPESCDFGNQPDSEDDNENNDEDTTTFFGTRSGGFNAPSGAQQVAGAAASMCPFLVDHMQMGWDNSPWEVVKLQLFLSMVMGYDNPITGVFGTITDENVKRFQAMYSDEILTPWFEAGIVPHNEPTGFVYKTTKWKINDIVCSGQPFPSLDNENLSENIDLD